MDCLKRRTSRVEINTCKCSEIRRLPVPFQLLEQKKTSDTRQPSMQQLGQPRHEWATSGFWPQLLLSALNLAAGVGHVEYLTNCIMLHNRLEHELAAMINFGSQMGQMTSTVWKDSNGTSLLQLQQWHPCK